MNRQNQNLSSQYPSINLLRALLQTNKKQGFTLIELLVVVIIIGVLSAIALPQTMGMIGRSRESEAKNLMGAMNRAQQAYFQEKADFATSTQQLEVPVGNEKYYTIFLHQLNSVTVGGLQGAKGKDNQVNGTRDYVAGVSYDSTNRIYDSVVCRSTDKNNQYNILGLRATNTTTGTGTVTGITVGTQAQCDPTVALEALR